MESIVSETSNLFFTHPPFLPFPFPATTAVSLASIAPTPSAFYSGEQIVKGFIPHSSCADPSADFSLLVVDAFDTAYHGLVSVCDTAYHGLVSVCDGLVSVCDGLVSVCHGLVSVCHGLVSVSDGLVSVFDGLVSV